LNYNHEKKQITTTKEEIKQKYIQDENEPPICCDFTPYLLYYKKSQKNREL
jgi:hypothetical protein